MKFSQGIPAPTPRRSYGFALMKVGQSFDVEVEAAASLRAAAAQAQRLGHGRFITRAIYDEQTGDKLCVRCWRIPDKQNP